jgi:hypothetical protein
VKRKILLHSCQATVWPVSAELHADQGILYNAAMTMHRCMHDGFEQVFHATRKTSSCKLLSSACWVLSNCCTPWSTHRPRNFVFVGATALTDDVVIVVVVSKGVDAFPSSANINRPLLWPLVCVLSNTRSSRHLGWFGQ